MSKIEVDAITQQSGTTLTVGGGASKTVVADATTVTLGRCGGTVALASGATQSGFGRTGTVDWQTGSIKTATFTAVNGQGFFANTSGGAFVMNLPAGTAGNIVSVVDYTNTFQTNNLTVTPNGSQKIGGVSTSAALSTEGQSVTFVYVDDIEGWKNIQDSTSNIIGNAFIEASGGTELTCGNFKTHIFTGPGTFVVSNAGSPDGSTVLDYLVVAGGGASGSRYFAGGGGAGGFRTFQSTPAPTSSPLKAPAGITASVASFPIAVGAGGAAAPGAPSGARGCAGAVSTFSTITSAGGGGGGFNDVPGGGGDGGSGGGGGSNAAAAVTGGSGNTPPVSPAQGKDGGDANPGASYVAGGGGGASECGHNYNASPGPGEGGDGSYVADAFIGPTAPSYGTPGPVGSSRYFAGGGGGGAGNVPGPSTIPGGSGGGGNGKGNATTGNAGTVNTGGGGGGNGNNVPGPAAGAAGGSGIVIIRYQFQ